MMKDELVLFEADDRSVTIPVRVERETVWLNRSQMAELFDRDVKTIGKHINNALREELENSVVANFATTAADGKVYQMEYYNLDMIISVGYRVKSKRGVEFRRWANTVLKQYIMDGYALNQKRLADLGAVVRLMQRTEKSLDAKQVLSVIERYSEALNLLDSYDHQTLQRPNGNAATMFLYFLDKNDALFLDGKKRIADHTLVALTIMIAESKPDEKEMMVSVIMNCIS